MLAAERYESVWNTFLQALNHDPTACFRAFQCEQHVNKLYERLPRSLPVRRFLPVPQNGKVAVKQSGSAATKSTAKYRELLPDKWEKILLKNKNLSDIFLMYIY